MAVKPFLKWAGGKTQLIQQIEKQLPVNISDNPFTYIELFVGSGAVLFWMLKKFPNLEQAIIGNSEMQHLYFAYASSLIRTFMDDESLVLTIRGRKYTPEFSFKVGNNLTI